MQIKTVLITGIGGLVARQVYYSLKLSSNSYRLITCDCNVYSPVIYTDEIYKNFKIVPNSLDSEYFNEINKICNEEIVDYLFITNEKELEIVIKSPEKLNVLFLLPHKKYFDIFHSKYKTNNLLSKFNEYKIVPESLRINSIDDISYAFNIFGYPIWLRSSVGQAAFTAKSANTVDDAKSWIESKGGYCDYIASEFLPGKNLAWTCLYFNNELICSTVHERISYFMGKAIPSGISGIANISRTVHRDDVCRIGENAIELILKKTGVSLSGIITIDMKEDKNQNPLITEINPRPTNTLHLTKAGCNFAELLLEVYEGKKIKKPKYNACDADFYYLRDVDCPPIIIRKDELLSPF